MATHKGKEVAEKQANLPADLMDELLQDAEDFREDMSRDDMAIPFIQILQQLSPQCVEGDPEYLENAKSGMLFNTVSRELFDGKNDGILVVPISYKASYIEWVPRAQGGGFVHEYDVADGSTIITARSQDTGQDIIQQNTPLGTPGNQLSYTHTHFVFVLRDDGTYEPAVLSMASTQVKHSKRWNFLIQNLKVPGTVKAAPRFFGVWRAKTTMNKNDQGTWYTWNFAKEKTIADLEGGNEVYHAAKEFARSVHAGEHADQYAKAAEQNPSVSPEGTTTDRAEAAHQGDEEAEGAQEIPF